ncbi:response regulator transcription factor [Paracrocinitomix mangrovi]|uniref:response regulator transcription factor n=1 Tax=Paracrocinitomix mangrovi TaxID=2862509 RepID=UPI001C8DFDF9|nr:response regulator transcription factor [Paracrocinitomix mangrovi]UKN01301.1 response regulator transcription factor [Paracrocinitomix mangrovi]
MIDLILADSNELIRVGLRTIFKDEEFRIIGEAESTEELLDQIKTFKPQVVLIDYTSDGFTIDAVPAVKALDPQVQIVGITPLQTAQTLVHAIKSGVTSYIKKDCSLEEIKNAVVETANNNTFFCGTILETIRTEGINIESIEEVDFSCDPVMLSDREREIITLIAEGHTNAAISEKLFLSKHTVNTHRKNIMAKLGVKNTAGIVMYAVKEKYTSPNKYLFSADS